MIKFAVHAEARLEQALKGLVQVDEVAFSRLIQDAQCADDVKSAPRRRHPRRPLVDQHVIGVQFLRQANGVNLTRAELQISVDPRGSLDQQPCRRVDNP